MFEEMMENLREELRADIEYFKKWNVKSANLAKGQKFLQIDDEELRSL